MRRHEAISDDGLDARVADGGESIDADADRDTARARVVVTGTPGTGKTTAVERVETGLAVVHLNEWIAERGLYAGYDDERDTRVVDLDAVRRQFPGGGLVESHLAHHLPAGRVVVLRCHPSTLCERLIDRGEPSATAEENAESEALDLILGEAVDRHGPDVVHEVETTDRDPDATASEIEAVLAGERDPGVGRVSYVDYLV
jgi:adenylate kinase